MAVMRLHCSTCFSLVAASGTFSLVAVHRLLMLQSIGSRAWTSVVAVPGLKNTGSSVVAQGLTCSNACDIFLDEGLNLCLLHWQADSLPLDHQGSPRRTDSEAEAPVLQLIKVLTRWKRP